MSSLAAQPEHIVQRYRLSSRKKGFPMKTIPLSTYDEVREALRNFQEGYHERRIENIDAFMEMFVPEADIELIGTGGITPGDDEWCLNRKSVRSLIEDDWNYWGDVDIQVEDASVHIHGDVAWVSAPGTVTRNLNPNQSYQNYLDNIQGKLERDRETGAQEKLLEIVRGAANTLYEAHKGPTYVWPFRFTAILALTGGLWRFHQVQFSFPTTRFPDVRYSQPK